MGLRESNIERLEQRSFDAIIIGGGINGAVSAAALAGRGVDVALIDKGDWSGFTSQESSNLAWGGIKYMQSLEFGLVRDLCMSRNHLIRNYPSIVQEIRFFTTVAKGFRLPTVFVWAGTWLYWLIGNGFTKRPRYLTRADIEREEPIINSANAAGGFEYSDSYLHDNDARFVFRFVRSALTAGCIAANYVESLGGTREADGWRVRCRDGITGREFDVRARVLINAAGPYVDGHNAASGQKTEHRHVFSKGIHLIVPRLSEHKRVLTFFASDGRPFFLIPMGVCTCIGTTDTRVGEPETEVTDEDRQFVLDNVNALLKADRPVSMSDVIAERCGVRPLVVKGQVSDDTAWDQLSRRHEIEVNEADRHISIFGGKLTDCLNVGDEVTDFVKDLGVPIRYPKYRWYGEPPDEVRDEFFHQAELMDLDQMTSPTASEPLSTRLWRRYGSQALPMLENIREEPSQGEILIDGTEYIRAEIQHAARREMIVKLEDFMRRRSKISLVTRHEEIRKSPGLMEACEVLFGDEAQAKFDEYFEASTDAERWNSFTASKS